MTEAEQSHDEEIHQIVLGFNAEWITRKTFFKRMAALGYQQAEALELAESWEDECF
ncbi:hypothetical protein LCGC14_1798330 [marine sediment metagenome]|uniref:Uncharacterized protein n=1 Tax=marine sediment metagenome TaxID=412755 RepID=A0A0F9JPY1_9ZZZZ